MYFLLLNFSYEGTLLLVRGLELENVTIPDTAIVGSWETFRCDFQLGSDTLYSLKWYKDGNEFFRIVTKENRLAPIETFKLPGVNVDVSILALILSLIFSPSLLPP